MTGGCLCEKVRYAISAPVISQGICYCKQCRKSGGACGSPLMVLHRDAFKVSGAIASFETRSNRGSTVTRNFCPSCGSHVFSQISDVPEILTVKAATLDDYGTFTPQYLAWTESSIGALPDGVPVFPQNAPLELILGV